MAQPLEEKTYVLFDGAWWWLSWIFDHVGSRYAHLMRQTPHFAVKFAKLSPDLLALLPLTPYEYGVIQKAYKSKIAMRLITEGRSAIPRIGLFADGYDEDPDDPHDDDEEQRYVN